MHTTVYTIWWCHSFTLFPMHIKVSLSLTASKGNTCFIINIIPRMRYQQTRQLKSWSSENLHELVMIIRIIVITSANAMLGGILGIWNLAPHLILCLGFFPSYFQKLVSHNTRVMSATDRMTPYHWSTMRNSGMFKHLSVFRLNVF